MRSVSQSINERPALPVCRSSAADLQVAIEETYRREGWQGRGLDNLLRERLDLARRQWDNEVSAQ